MEKLIVFPFFFVTLLVIIYYMKSLRKILIGLIMLTGMASSLCVAQTHVNQWLETKSISGNFKAVVSQPDIEVFSAPNNIIIKVNYGVDVRLFTILGKLISVQHLEPGIFQYHLDSHGIYIIKTGETSCKIAI